MTINLEIIIKDKLEKDDNIKLLYVNYINCNIYNLSVVVNDINIFFSNYLKFFISLFPIVHYEIIDNSLYVIYENSIFLKFNCYKELNINYEVPILINKGININISNAFTNNELIINLNKYFYNLIDYINSKKINDNIYAFNKAINVINSFVLIYRTFFDSYNAKYGYLDLVKTMDNKSYLNLEKIMETIKYESINESILVMTNIIDKLIQNLPLSLLNDLDVGFYNFVKKELYKLS